MREIPLTQGQVALVDDEDFDRVNQFKWYATKHGRTYYAARTIRFSDGTKKNQYLHHFVTGKKGLDHQDGNGLNDQRYNLRVATQQQNLQAHRRKRVGTTSQYRGVRWHPKAEKWNARIGVDGREVYLGLFITEEAAARAYNVASKKFFGEFSSPNTL